MVFTLGTSLFSRISAVDTVWEQAVRSEAAVHSEGTVAAAVLWDAKQFYEHFNQHKRISSNVLIGRSACRVSNILYYIEV